MRLSKYLLLFLMSLCFLAVAVNSSSAAFLMNETFENGTNNTNILSSWGVQGAPQTWKYFSPALNGSFMGRTTTSNTAAFIHKNFTDTVVNTTVTFWVTKVTGDNSPALFIIDGSQTGSMYTNSHFIRCISGLWSYYQTGNNSYVSLGDSCVAGTTYKFEILIHSFGASSLSDIKIDGVMRATNALSRGTVDNIGAFGLMGAVNPSTADIDNICIETGTWVNNCLGGAPPIPEVNDSVESTAVVKQVGTVTITTPSFQTVFSSSFNVSVNNTELYGAYSFNVLSNNNNDLLCELLIDGVGIGNVTRSNVNGVLGSVFLMSPFFSLTSGNHSQELRCLKSSGPAGFTISNAIGIGHFMIDEFNETIPHDEIFGNSTVSSGSSHSKIGELNFTISNRSLNGGLLKHLIIEWSSDYTNNAGSTELLNTFIQINNTNCSFFPRTVFSGNTGSVAGGCIIENVTGNDTYNIKFFANGSNALYDNGVLIVKEFILSSEEIQSGGGVLTGANFTGLVKLLNFSGGNLNHGLTNVFQLITLSIFSNESTTANFFINIIDGNNFTTINFTRDITTNVGVLIGQDVLENIPEDNYTIELWGDCGDALCTIAGGEVNGYLTDITTTISNSFNISVFDNFDDSSVLNFSAVDGATFTTTAGSLLYFSGDPFVNFTITSGFNGGYFNATFLNHNVSADLNVSLNQTLLSWNCSEKVSGDDLNCSSPLESVFFNYNVIGNPHSQSVNVSGYFERLITFNVSALQTGVLSANNFYSSNLSINSSSGVGTVSNCTYNITSLVYPSFFESVSGSPLATIGLINGSYTVLADCIGFAVDSVNVSVNLVNQNLNFSLFTVNSISFNIFNLSDTVLMNQLVEIELLGSSVTINSNTSNGTLFIDGLNDDTYKLTFSSAGFNPTILFATIFGNNHLNINAYMDNNTVEKDFIVQDNFGKLQGNVTITFIQVINGSEITIGQAKTDFSGRASIFLDETVEYSLFAVKVGFSTFTGQVIPTQPEYTITIFEEGFDRFISVFEDIIVFTPFNYVLGGSNANTSLIINSASGLLQWYGMNVTYRGVNSFVNTSGSAAGGVEIFNFTNIDANIEEFLNVTYFFKAVGYDVIVWNIPYGLSNVTPDNLSLSTGLFSDLDALERTDPIRGIVGFLIIFVLIIIFRAVSKDNSVAVIAGLMGVAICHKFTFLPRTHLIVSAIVLGVLLIADNQFGGRG